MFLDCQRARCDRTHFRREIDFVNHVRDRRDAQVHVLVTSQSTGGGTEYTFLFIGLQEFAGRNDTLRFVTSATDTEDERREGQTRTLQMGLMRYVAATPSAQGIRISYVPPRPNGGARQVGEQDPWNYWVFRVNLGGSLNGESSESEFSLDGGLAASRTTESWKIDMRARGGYRERRVELSEGREVLTFEDFSGSASVVRSLGDHWAAGAEANVSASTFFNQDLSAGVGPAIEWSFFPYEESTRRQVTLFYTAQVWGYDWDEMTIFDRTSEVRLQQSLELSAEMLQPWGSIRGSIEGSNYLHDFSLHRLDVGSNVRFRVVRGLDLNFSGSFARIKDQISLQRGDISDEDILTRRRQLGTDYRYRGRVGFSYRFGSIFNNVVNPRMEQF